MPGVWPGLCGQELSLTHTHTVTGGYQHGAALTALSGQQTWGRGYSQAIVPKTASGDIKFTRNKL